MSKIKRKIIGQSYEFFLKRSYIGTINDLEEHTGITKRQFLYHFKNKENVFKEVLKEYISPALSILANIPNVEKFTLKEAIEATLQSRDDFIDKVSNFDRQVINDFYYIKLIFDAMDYLEGFGDILNNLNKKECQAWHQVLENAKNAGEISCRIDTKLFTEVFMTVHLGLGLDYALFTQSQLTVAPLRKSYYALYNLILKESFK